MIGTKVREREVVLNRYYDPATGQFPSVDPAIDFTGQPYAYVADDPTNATDPQGLGSSWSSPWGCAYSLHTLGVETSPTGFIAHSLGLTAGSCVGGGAFVVTGAQANLCYVVTPSGKAGFTFTIGGGAGLGLNGLLGPMVSNAKSVPDLSRGFTGGGSAISDGLLGLGGEGAVGRNSCGRGIWTGELGWAPGLRTPLPRLGGQGFKSYTWIFGLNG